MCPWVLSCLLADLELVKLIWIGYVWKVLFVKYIVYIIIRSYHNVGFLIVLFLKRNRTRMKNHETLLTAVEYGFLIGMFLKGNKVSQSPISGGGIKSRHQFFIWFLVQFVKNWSLKSVLCSTVCINDITKLTCCKQTSQEPAFLCTFLVKSEPRWPHPKELKFKAKKQLLLCKCW